MTAAPTGMVRARRILVLANPRAGLRSGRRAGETAARVATRAGCTVTLERTERPGDATRLAASAASSGFDLVVVAGGDGTVNEAANGLAGGGVALGIAPAGTMNLLARVLKLPLDPERAVRAIIDGYRPFPVRPGSVAGRVFMLMVGTGFDAWVLRELLGGATRKIGFGDYVRGTFRGLRTFPFPRLTIEHDGRRVEAHTAIVGRSPLYGGFLRPTPHADLAVERLELCAIDGSAKHLALVFPRLWSGAHSRAEGVTLVRAERVEIACPIGDVPYHVDGELAGTLPVIVSLSERNLLLASPRRGS